MRRSGLNVEVLAVGVLRIGDPMSVDPVTGQTAAESRAERQNVNSFLRVAPSWDG